MGNPKRNHSVFDAIQELESEDVRAESKRQKRSTAQGHRAKAAQSQSKIYKSLVECRILMQRAVMGDNAEGCDDLLKELLSARQQLLGEEEKDYELDSLDDVLQSEYETCRTQWKEVLDRRHKDLRLQSGKSQFRVMDSSFWQQVDGTVEHENLRNSETEERQFDDSKVYQQLLKEFMASSNATNGQSKRVKQKSSKKQVDRRASKGRKIRYHEIPKLMNFTFPLSKPNRSNLDEAEWFQSLFGGAGKA